MCTYTKLYTLGLKQDSEGSPFVSPTSTSAGVKKKQLPPLNPPSSSRASIAFPLHAFNESNIFANTDGKHLSWLFPFHRCVHISIFIFQF